MIVSNTALVTANPAEAHNTADNSGSKEGYFVTLSAVSGVVTSTLVAATSTVPHGVILTGYPTDSYLDEVALMKFPGIVKVAVKSGETVTAYSFGMVASDGSVEVDTGASGRIRVCQFLEASGTSGLSGNVERLNAVLVDPPVTH